MIFFYTEIKRVCNGDNTRKIWCDVLARNVYEDWRKEPDGNKIFVLEHLTQWKPADFVQLAGVFFR